MPCPSQTSGFNVPNYVRKQYKDHNRMIYGDLGELCMLLVQQAGYTKLPYFLCEWNSRCELIDLRCDRELRAKYDARSSLMQFYDGFPRGRFPNLHKLREKVLIRRKNILRLLRFADSFIWEDLPPQDVATGNTSMGVLVRRLNSATKGFTIVFPIYYFLIYGSLILTSEKRVLTVDGWYPYDWTKSPAYEITIMIQTLLPPLNADGSSERIPNLSAKKSDGITVFRISTMVSHSFHQLAEVMAVVNTLGLASILYAFPPLYATLVVIACSQLEKVRNILSNIKQQCILSEALTTVDKKLVFETPEKMFAYMQDQLNECIRLHQQIIRFMNELEDNFSTLFVGILLILMIALCFASFAAVLAQRVRDAAFACDWIGAPVSFQRSLSFMIACANKEFILTAGKCVPVSKETMVNMIQESMSLFMFLLHVRERDEDQG
ncbi:hypothetical protein ANN_17294 [Periplaneta americana]|uniref:Odorant receptor n=1 Tax=Periplaneta americana TaxID=6978 RepID=A0ABQ8SSJ0_PERAM|nr:hypothetical protein ANN_17294 [Periplaneta americana]